ncbi:MAG: uroporphyrinogen-III C-methyltransferase [Hyphomicrobiaceae bacterium]|nr:uroporphyrinogen-III C-methyltransferase [Hyphomicrobiaceae bacterium]
MRMPGRVYLVGAGPGDPDLLTVKAARLLASAEVVVYDRLVSQDILELVRDGATMIAVGKEPGRHPVPQGKINRILIAQARAGYMTVRLKGGDPFIFGRGSEEAAALAAAGLRCEVVPGITAAQGAAASIGIPLTHRGMASSVRFITGHRRAGEPLAFDWSGLANAETTLVVYMGAATIGEVTTRLLAHGRAPRTPVLAISRATTSAERRLVSNLANIPCDMIAANLDGPVLFIIGEVVGLHSRAEAGPVLHAALAEIAAGDAGALHA